MHDTATPGLAARIEAATPPHRDRTVDALRAVAILGVVLGHWLVTALVADGAGGLVVRSPLSSQPMFTPVSWILQTLALFFLVGGYSAALSHRSADSYRTWVRTRLRRLLRPLPAPLLGWIPVAAALSAAGLPAGTLERLIRLVISPLWFLLVYAVLIALTPLVRAVCDRLGPYGVAIPIGVTAAVDLGRFALGGPAWLGWLNLLAGWLVPFYLGMTWAALDRRAAAGLCAGGVLATVALVGYAGYPASMVGLPGAAVSNLNPPTLAAVTFGIAQVGLALLLRERLARWTRRPRAWAGVAMINLSAMTLFLWHQTAMLLVTLAALWFGVLPGLHTAPVDPVWLLDRLLWLPAFALVLAGCLLVFGRLERPGDTARRLRGGSRRAARRRSSC